MNNFRFEKNYFTEEGAVANSPIIILLMIIFSVSLMLIAFLTESLRIFAK